jgi:hypothetical protein
MCNFTHQISNFYFQPVRPFVVETENHRKILRKKGVRDIRNQPAIFNNIRMLRPSADNRFVEYRFADLLVCRICHLEVKLAPRSELCPLGVLFTPSFTPELNNLMLRKTKQWTEVFRYSSWGSNFAPRNERKKWYLISLLFYTTGTILWLLNLQLQGCHWNRLYVSW